MFYLLHSSRGSRNSTKVVVTGCHGAEGTVVISTPGSWFSGRLLSLVSDGWRYDRSLELYTLVWKLAASWKYRYV